jgi:hypothetical protein
MNLYQNRKGVTDEVFRLALAIIVVAAVLALFAVFFTDIRASGQTSINATASALEDFSQKIANRTAYF